MSPKLVVFRSSWTHGPELAQVLHDLYAWEKAQARNELVRVCYSERLVGLPRNKKISASVHRRQKLAAGDRDERPDSRLWHARRRRRRRQGLHGSRRTFQRRGRNVVLASRRCKQCLPGSQSGVHQRKVSFSWPALPRGGCSRSWPFRPRWRRSDELYG